MLDGAFRPLSTAPYARRHVGHSSVVDVGTGEAIVLIHGVGLNADAWQPQIEAFSQHYRVIAIDMPGHGESALPQLDATLDAYVDQVKGVLDQLQIGAATIIGHSMGGLVAIGFALAHPSRTLRLGVFNSVYEREDDKRKAVEQRADQILQSGTNGDIDEPIRRWFDQDSQSGLAKRVRYWLESVNPIGYGIAYRLFATSDRNFSGLLERIKVPAIFATGSHDPNSTPAMARQMASATSHGEAVILEGERHMMTLTAPEKTNELIKALLDRPSTLLDPRELRKAFGSFMTGITVVTTREKNGTPRGFTANSFTSVSLDPPLLLICIGKSASSYETFSASTSFAVNILSEQQRDVSAIFASKRPDKFDAVSWHWSALENPLIHETLAHFDCHTKSMIDAGDHVILLGEIDNFAHSEKQPLGYFKGNYVTPSLEQDAVAAARQGHHIVGILLEYDGELLLLPDENGHLSPPYLVRGTTSLLIERLRNLGLEIDLGFIFAVFENSGTKAQSIWYRGYAHGHLPKEARLASFEDLNERPIADEAVASMLRRYAEERSNGRFRIYAGDHERGEIKSVE